MRWLASAVFAFTLILPADGHAQESQPSKRGDRLFLSAGPGTTFGPAGLTGLHFRADYHLIPLERVAGLRVHLGAFWTPTQSYSVPSILYGDGSTFEGTAQAAHLDFGVTGSVTPWPRGRVSPYIIAGVAALQRWSYGSGYHLRPDGTLGTYDPPRGGTRGGVALVVGAGLRVRAGGRLLQFEVRQLPGIQSTFGVGTALHF